MTTIRTWEQAETGLANAWPSFQPRTQQRRMAQGVTQVLRGNSRHPVLMAQAGCGVGKSLAYLISSIISGGRVIVSVSTIALQEQLMGKDLPTLRDTLFPDLTFAMLKGRSNYLCKRAASKNNVAWSMKPEANGSGERQDLVAPVTDEQWREMSTDAEGCVGRGACPFGEECFSEQARRAALQAQVLVVNTSLLTQDLRLRAMTRGKASLLGDFDTLVVDEAHEMADIVASGLSTNLTLRRITDTTSKLAYHLDAAGAASWVTKVNELAASYFNGARAWFDMQSSDVRTADLADDDRKALLGLCEAFAPILGAVSRAQCSCEPVFDPETGDEHAFCEYHRRTDSLVSDLSKFASDDATANVVWMERGRTGNVVLSSSPAEVGGFLDAALWRPKYADDPTRAVLCSATLGVGGDFSYVARRLGLSSYEDLDVGTPFNYGTQARLYLPPADSPNPSKQRNEWLSWSRTEMSSLVQAAEGGALLLFTSTSAMRDAHEHLSGVFRRQGITPLLQGDGVSNRELAALFAQDVRSALFATRSFMTGVDFAGDTCRLVIIDKMPFPVPTEPVFKARCDAAVSRFGTGADFRRVSIPEMSLVLIQAFGRLIRTVEDTGVVAILDPRMRAGWAGSIRRSLPPAPVVSTIAEVDQFYQGLRP